MSPALGSNDVDVCVIGSGFGGGPAALRAAEAGASVLVVEQGERWDGRDGSRAFKQLQGDFSYYTDLFDLYAGVDPSALTASVVIGGKGLGGGSLVYSMVSLRAPSMVFDDPAWPDAVDRSTLDPFYERAEGQLGIAQVLWEGDRPADDWRLAARRDAMFAEVCADTDMSCDPVPVAVNEKCENLGWCTTGCTKGGKNSVDLRYLGPAEDLGAQMRTGTKVDWIEPAGSAESRRWRINTRNMATGDSTTVLADDVFVAAGTVGSAVILQSSARRLPGGISSQAGRNMSRGGDMMIPLLVPDDFRGGDVGDMDVGDMSFDDMDMAPGKIIGSASFEHLFTPPAGMDDDWAPFIIEPMMILPVISSLIVADPDGRIGEGDMRTFGLDQKHLMQKWGSRLLHLGVMGIDGMDGRVTVSAGGSVKVHWGLSPQTKKLYRSAKTAVDNMAAAIGGERLPSWDEIRGDGLSIHPLGTCRMADSAEVGVVDHACRVFTAEGDLHEGLYVTDASTYSSPIAVNTSLTAAAISERAMSLWSAR